MSGMVTLRVLPSQAAEDDCLFTLVPLVISTSLLELLEGIPMPLPNSMEISLPASTVPVSASSKSSIAAPAVFLVAGLVYFTLMTYCESEKLVGGVRVRVVSVRRLLIVIGIAVCKGNRDLGDKIVTKEIDLMIRVICICVCFWRKADLNTSAIRVNR